jgi:long-subunit fatty acid transport protein
VLQLPARLAALLPFVLVLQLFPAVCASQLVTIELNLSDPGARSLGFGGAFVALADDATAAFANPAGLVQLLDPELSVEGRLWSYSTPYTYGGRVSGTPTGIGLDTTADLRMRESSARIAGLSYVSFVYPHRRWAFAFYRHQWASFELKTEINGLFGDWPGSNQIIRFDDQRTFNDLEISNYGIAVAYRLTEGLSLGLGLSYFDGMFIGTDDEYEVDDGTIESFFGPCSFLTSRLSERSSLKIDDGDLALSFGFLGRLSEQWRIGGFYRQGPELDFEYQFSAVPPGPSVSSVSGMTPVSFPDSFGLGVAYRSPDGQLTASLEWDRVEYSDWVDSLRPLVDPEEQVNDVNELHLGAEYAFIRSTPVFAIRVGAWHDPDHRVYSVGGDIFEQALLSPGDDEIHLTAGFGISFERIQVDLAVDLSDTVDTGSISMIYSF